MRLETQIILEYYIISGKKFLNVQFKMNSNQELEIAKQLIRKLEVENMKLTQEISILRNLLTFSRHEEQ